MTTNGQHHPHEAAHGEAGGATVQILERLDNWAHVVVAAFFILMATTVIVHMGFIFLRQLPLIVPAAPAVETSAAAKPTETQPPALHEKPTETTPALPGMKYEAKASETKAQETHSETPPDPFVRNSLELLSNILFVVILLELLRTIITYLQTHDIQAIMQEFLVVGIISSVRKILLVGAEASLRQGASQSEFIQEATGVVIDIVGILLLILGLVMLKRAFGSKVQKEMQEV